MIKFFFESKGRTNKTGDQVSPIPSFLFNGNRWRTYSSFSIVRGLQTWEQRQLKRICSYSLLWSRKIADILTSLDDQIEAIELKLVQLESLKKSLMGDLLTGRVRVSGGLMARRVQHC